MDVNNYALPWHIQIMYGVTRGRFITSETFVEDSEMMWTSVCLFNYERWTANQMVQSVTAEALVG